MSLVQSSPAPSTVSGSRAPAWIIAPILVLGVALLKISARTQVPFWPVPMTLQTLAVLALAIGLGPRLATSVFLAYLAAGLAGLPVFAGSPERGIGWAYLVGPTGGFLVGCLVASGLVGRLAAGGGTLVRVGAMLAGLVAIFACGVAWLALFVPAGKLLALGVLPFLPGEAVKVAVVATGAALFAPALTRLRAWLP